MFSGPGELKHLFSRLSDPYQWLHTRFLLIPITRYQFTKGMFHKKVLNSSKFLIHFVLIRLQSL